MSQEILTFLEEIMQADGKIDEREEMAIEKVQSIFKEVNQLSPKKIVKSGWDSITGKIRKIVSK